MAAQRASAADLTPVSAAAVAQLATAVGLPLCSAAACLCASSLRRSSSAASIFRPIHSSNAGLIISRTRSSIEVSSVLVRFNITRFAALAPERTRCGQDDAQVMVNGGGQRIGHVSVLLAAD